MDKGRFLIETHLRTHKSVKELAAAHGISESWLYKLLARYRREGPAGLEPRSRRPHTSPTRIADVYEDEIVEWRKRLAENGLDAGAESIHFYMSTPGRNVPSISTIHRVLVGRGFVVPEPHKRPKSSWIRFEADFPNECLEAFMAREKAGPSGAKIDVAGCRIRHDKVDRGGSVTLGYKGKLHHIAVGCPYAGWRVVMLINGLDVQVLGLDGSPLRHLTLDPSVDYQRLP